MIVFEKAKKPTIKTPYVETLEITLSLQTLELPSKFYEP